MPQHTLQVGRRRADLKAFGEQVPAALAHGVAIRLRHRQPLLQRCRGAGNCVRMHQACTGRRHLAADVHRLGDRHRQPAGQRFCHRNAEVLLVRRQAEQLGGMERAPLEFAAHHPKPVQPIRHSQLLRPALQGRLPALLIRACQHQLKHGVLPGHNGKGFDQQIHSLLGVDAAQEQQQPLPAQLRPALQELLTLLGGITWRSRCAIGDHPFGGLVQPERLPGQLPFPLAGEQHRRCIPQQPVFSPGPVAPLLEVLDRVALLEPRIEHAVGLHQIGHRPAVQRTPGQQPVVLPQPMHDHHIVLRRQLAQPRHQAAAIAIAPRTRAQGLHTAGKLQQPRCCRIIQAGHRALHTQRRQLRRYLTDPFHRAAVRWV